MGRVEHGEPAQISDGRFEEYSRVDVPDPPPFPLSEGPCCGVYQNNGSAAHCPHPWGRFGCRTEPDFDKYKRVRLDPLTKNAGAGAEAVLRAIGFERFCDEKGTVRLELCAPNAQDRKNAQDRCAKESPPGRIPVSVRSYALPCERVAVRTGGSCVGSCEGGVFAW
jgi:hypothetical protein